MVMSSGLYCCMLRALLRGNSVGLFKPLASKRRSSLLNEHSLLEKIVLKFLPLPDVIQSRIGCLGNIGCSDVWDNHHRGRRRTDDVTGTASADLVLHLSWLQHEAVRAAHPALARLQRAGRGLQRGDLEEET